MRRCRLLALTFLLVLGLGRPASAESTHGTYRFPVQGQIADVRLYDMNRDGALDVVALINVPDLPDGATQQVLVLLSPAQATKRTYFATGAGAATTLRADVGAIALGSCGRNEAHANRGAGTPQLCPVIRCFHPQGWYDLSPSGAELPSVGSEDERCLLGGSAGEDAIFWDGVARLRGRAPDQFWYPLGAGEGALRVVWRGSTKGEPLDRVTLALDSASTAASTAQHVLRRSLRVPNLVAADLNNDGVQELIALRGTELLVWSAPTAGQAGQPDTAMPPTWRMDLPFLAPDPEAPRGQIRTPRVQIEDIDADGFADLIVTLVLGQQEQAGSFKTILYHYRGPFRDPESGALVAPSARLDTPGVTLHPRFVDVDGDGSLDYVGDSIRGSNPLTMISRLMGKDPPVTWEGFRGDAATGTFTDMPSFRLQRTYPSREALGNTFGQNGWFGGDFDGDGHKDLLDLGNLTSVTVLRGQASSADPGRSTFETPLVGPIPVKEGLSARAKIGDLNKDGRSDAVLWNTQALYLLVSKPEAR